MSNPSPVRPPGYELFFSPLQIALNPSNYERVQFAYIASKFGHAGQTRDGGSRYFDHPKAATWIYINELGGRDPRAIIVLLLHDISEDSYLLSPYRMGHNFGPDIATDVRALTKLRKKKETTAEYLGRVINQGPRAILAKLCDRLHNLRTLRECTEDKQIKQIGETELYHLPLLVPALAKHGEPWAEYAALLEQKIQAAIASLK
jgi:GTP pyrophosphokinase